MGYPRSIVSVIGGQANDFASFNSNPAALYLGGAVLDGIGLGFTTFDILSSPIYLDIANPA